MASRFQLLLQGLAGCKGNDRVLLAMGEQDLCFVGGLGIPARMGIAAATNQGCASTPIQSLGKRAHIEHHRSPLGEAQKDGVLQR